MSNFTELSKSFRVYHTRSFDWETKQRRGYIEWLDIIDRNGKHIEWKPFHRGDDIPKKVEKKYWKFVNNNSERR